MTKGLIEVEIKGKVWAVVWARQITDNLFETSLVDQDKGYTIYLTKIEDGMLVPLSCLLYVEKNEEDVVRLMRRLNMNDGDIMKKIIEIRIAALS